MQASEIVENTQGLMDKSLLVEPGAILPISNRKQELAQKQTKAQNIIDGLKMEISSDDRELKGISLFENDHVTIIDDEASKILSQDGKKEYLVNYVTGTCQCRDHEFRGKYGVVCQHRIADRLARDAIHNKPTSEGVTFASVECV